MYVETQGNFHKYALTSADLGSRIRIMDAVWYLGGDESAWSEPTAVVTNPTTAGTKPANTAPPRIKGRTDVGNKLKVSLGAWKGSAPITYSEQWKSCNAKGKRCQNIKGATKRAFTLSGKYIGHRLAVTVRASNSAGSAAARSRASSVVTR